jgi:Cysteine-rich secretory protein family
MRLSRTVSFSLTLIAVLMAAPALAEEVSPPVPPVVDIPPPPPLPATIDPSEPRYVVARPVYAEAAPVAAQPAYQYQYGDPYGFTAWLNGVRAQNGRGPVGHDPNLSAWASANNGQQQARGMGHHVMGAARRQNSGMGAASTVWQMWMASPAHQAALLDPTITMIGIAASGSYWTFNAY